VKFCSLLCFAYHRHNDSAAEECRSDFSDAVAAKIYDMGALSAVHGYNPLNIFYERLVGRGRPKKVAVVAAARKLLTWAWVLFSRQTTWNPDLHSI
jgi:hypothetical protein